MSSSDPIEKFLQAQSQTKVFRGRKNILYTFGCTRLPYVFLAESTVNIGDIVKRTGEVTAKPPQIIAPGIGVEFEGFEFDEENADAIPVILNRLVQFPPAKYSNSSSSLEVIDGPLEAATETAMNSLDRKNDSRTAVINGPENLWGFSVLGYVCQMVAKSASSNIDEFFERHKGHLN